MDAHEKPLAARPERVPLSPELIKLGHDVRLMPPAYVKKYVRRQKNDAADAAAICEAVTRPSMRFVPVRSIDNQAVLMHHKVREMLVAQRTQLINALRGQAYALGEGTPVDLAAARRDDAKACAKDPKYAACGFAKSGLAEMKDSSAAAGARAKMTDTLTILRHEFDAEPGSFLLKLRCELEWDRAAFTRLTNAMAACCRDQEGSQNLERWVAQGAWYTCWFVSDWTKHPSSARPNPPAYYNAACERLWDLALWYFAGVRPFQTGAGLAPM